MLGWRVLGAAVATLVLLAVTATLRVSDWPALGRAVLVVPLASFWAATAAAVIEGVRPGRTFSALELALLGLVALIFAQVRVFFG